MTQKSPLVSVIIPVYNAAPFVSRAIESVLHQTFKDYEIIVVDDGSSDGSRDEILKFADRLTYVHQANRGQAVARNRAIARSTGQYLAFLDADDLWYPQKLQRCVDMLEADSGAAMVCSTYTLMSLEGRIVIPHVKLPTSGGLYPRILLGNFLSCQGSLIRRDVFAEVGGFCAETTLYEDWTLFARVTRRYEVQWIDEPLFCYRSSKPGRYTPAQIALRLQREHRVLDIAFREDPSLGRWFRARCRASVYMDLARACFFRRQFLQAFSLACRSWLRMPLQTEVYTFLPRVILGKLRKVLTDPRLSVSVRSSS
ncbi:MAG: hypothetical protein A3I61_19815 [Acidobacteria bacterium RIFCSPLOWO2_02_FULL_68_18]|nr:MAG: hypothetical protein A3I61_19815 [Acidobacteria bacterium RIFCSPLOWO2_02_FULL_68_18]OFW48288.1 MAG: hypothetical protein A3G77_03320 [Acidobacteria bacterium RIFCSPLOWO2_12_FULL_68_19]